MTYCILQVWSHEAAAQSLARLTSIGKMAPHRIQACLRPLLPDGLPSIGAVPGTRNAFIATGHNLFGVLWAPGTGKALSELILDGHSSSLDLTPFHPARFVHGERVHPIQRVTDTTDKLHARVRAVADKEGTKGTRRI